DGFRVDMAEMVPVEFWSWLIPKIKKEYPQVIFIAECYKPECYHAYLQAGFDYLYDKVGMYDYLRGVTSKNWPVEGITQVWQQTDDIRHRMLYFLENHDEQRIASGFYCGRGTCAEPAMIVAATLGTNPVMIYAGQELGEKGMDSEGYSGMDGRTTIFDYWGIRSIQAWANEGKFDGKGLDEEQNELRSFYKKLLNIARQNKAITVGKMYDLVYAQSQDFNKHEQYAYIRKSGEQILLMVLNFDDKQVDVSITIPQEAFDCLSMYAWDRVTAFDMLSERWLNTNGEFQETMNEKTMICFTPNTPIKMHLPAWKGVILRIENKLF
ncbi:MAG: alpha-amylase, partial [Paludibacteraceae bacterium]|nr:alpha-amylase [Paludibacteraceae bacterium]